MTEFPDEKIWKQIIDIITDNPGVHLSKIAEFSNYKISVVEGYLRAMEENNEIIALNKDGFIQYFSKKRRIQSLDRRTPETRQKIYDLIRKNPGLHVSRIAEMLNMTIPLAIYHLTQLEKNQLIKCVKDSTGYYKRYYEIDNIIGKEDKELIELLRQEQPKKIIVLLLQYPTLKHKEIHKYLDMAPSTLSYHLGKLVENGIVDVVQYGSEKGYALTNKKQIIKIIRRYKLSLKIEKFTDFWADVNLRGK